MQRKIVKSDWACLKEQEYNEFEGGVMRLVIFAPSRQKINQASFYFHFESIIKPDGQISTSFKYFDTISETSNKVHDALLATKSFNTLRLAGGPHIAINGYKTVETERYNEKDFADKVVLILNVLEQFKLINCIRQKIYKLFYVNPISIEEAFLAKITTLIQNNNIDEAIAVVKATQDENALWKLAQLLEKNNIIAAISVYQNIPAGNPTFNAANERIIALYNADPSLQASNPDLDLKCMIQMGDPTQQERLDKRFAQCCGDSSNSNVQVNVETLLIVARQKAALHKEVLRLKAEVVQLRGVTKPSAAASSGGGFFPTPGAVKRRFQTTLDFKGKIDGTVPSAKK